MDVFHYDSSSISSTMIDTETSIADEITEVKFEAHSEFDLNFFDTPDDSMTQTAFSSPKSIESSSSPTPEPHMPLTPTTQHSITSSNVSINQQNMAQPAMVNIKHGKAVDCTWTFFPALKRETRTAFFCFAKIQLPHAHGFAKLHHDAEFSFQLDSGFAAARETFEIINYDNSINACDSLEAQH